MLILFGKNSLNYTLSILFLSFLLYDSLSLLFFLPWKVKQKKDYNTDDNERKEKKLNYKIWVWKRLFFQLRIFYFQTTFFFGLRVLKKREISMPYFEVLCNIITHLFQKKGKKEKRKKTKVKSGDGSFQGYIITCWPHLFVYDTDGGEIMN